MAEVKTPHVYTAMIAVKKKLSTVGLSKDRSAPKEVGGYRFRGIDDLYNALCHIEAEENLLVFPRVIAERTEYQEKNGKLQTHVHITMEFKFVSAIDGSSDTASAIGEGIDSGDKASGKAQSNAMKFGHLEIYKIPTEGLSDDVEASHEEVGRKVEKTPAPPQDLTRQLEASVQWGSWEIGVIGAMQKAPTMGALQEVWAEITEKKPPEVIKKRLVVIKDDRKRALQPNGEARP